MKFNFGSANKIMPNVKAYFQAGNKKQNYTNEAPLREELFSSDKMKQFAKSLAERHILSQTHAPDPLLSRLHDNEQVLNAVRKILEDAVKQNRIIPPAGEWMVDNFYLIEEQILTARKHLPSGYSKTLPKLLNADSPGMTRVYDIALQIISHSDGRVDLERIGDFIDAYQSVLPLEIGELWAIPIMLRLTLIENLRRVSSLLAIDIIDKKLADFWARQMLEVFERDPKNVILITGDMARSNPPMVSAFVSEMNRQLLGKGSGLALSLIWIEQRLNEEGLTTSDLVNAEIQKQAVNQVSISNSINSLRFLSMMDWRDFVEYHSIIDKTLRTDRDGIYGRMDFATRDSYRHVVENIAKKSKISENEVARIAIKLAGENTQTSSSHPGTTHVGYYLVGKGLARTKKLAGIRPSVAGHIMKWFANNRLFTYLSSIFTFTVLISYAFFGKAYHDTTNIWLLSLIGLLLILAASQLAIILVNSISMVLVKPRLLPRMDFSNAIPGECRTLVVIPALLINSRSIEDLVEGLEVRFLANRDENLVFGLLTDFTDAEVETRPDDARLLQLVKQKILDLKKKYEDGKMDIFYLFHRPRQWNPKEGIWMSYERKRGKLTELNSLLRGHSQDRFSFIIGDINVLQQIKYVITLDSDTQLPRGSAWKMIATLAHPLNRALYNEKKKRVTEGYGILQPRVTVSLPEPSSSFYNKMHGNEPGIDPYTQATSDVYQDLFSEGSFIGKGIYDIDIFEKALKGRLIENRILSHDLLEGCIARSGLLSDVELYEKYPMTYRLDMKRRSRWVRGDWQIFPWFLPLVPGPDKHLQKNPLSTLSRWKIFDNIRRSLVPAALTALIIIGWILLKATLFWTIALTGIIVCPIIIILLIEAGNKPEDLIFSHHLHILIRNAGDVIVRTTFTAICLPFEAFINLVAISKTIWRVLVSHKKLLEWAPSANIEKGNRQGLINSYSFMWSAPFLSLIVLIYLSIYVPGNLVIAGPVLVLWLISPFITWYTSKRPPKPKAALTDQQNTFLLKVARKTWGFFEDFVTAENNWLPPDNFQEHPSAVVAHRTSPTNIGLYLLSNLTARDFGYISTGQFLERSAKTINTMQMMERHQGHFFNWYSTQSLDPLLPKYISTVDSGNLAAHLLTFRQGLFEILHQKIIRPRIFTGLMDTFLLLKDTLAKDDFDLFQEFFQLLEIKCLAMPARIEDVNTDLKHLSVSYEKASSNLKTDAGSMAQVWQSKLKKQIAQAIEEIQFLAPWFLLPPESKKFVELTNISFDITLKGLNARTKSLISEFDSYQSDTNSSEENAWLDQFQNAVKTTKKRSQERINLIEKLGHECIGLADMEWDFLYSKSMHLLSIGYRVEESACDPGYYDLLASEARLCTFVAIAQGKLPEESWFALGRLLTKAGGEPILLSWGGSMFEYLMPLLVMPTYENTLLDQTYKATVKRQIEYGKQRGTPWGISESGYNMVDAASNYQYKAFGVPGLGLKRGLETDLVIAPYATALSLIVSPESSCLNLETLSDNGLDGAYGFYEAVDYTPSRLQRGQTSTIILSFMAHHQGMSLLSLGYLMLDRPMQRRFEAEPQFQATLLLLQERIPKASSFYKHTTAIADIDYQTTGTAVRVIETANTPIPELQLLSNGKYHVMITNSGGGYSHWKDLAVTRWHEDVTCDNWGTFCYIQDFENDEYWSNTYQPCHRKSKTYEVAFSQGRIDFHVNYHDLDTHTAIVVSPEDDIEMRRIQITNKSGKRKTIEITSYAEVVLATPLSDAMQPAFSNLFVQTEILPKPHAIICSRRPRSAEEHTPWMFHSMIVHGKENIEASYETDRMKFIGHGNTVANPKAMSKTGPLSGSVGSVLDPIVSIRFKIFLEVDETITLDLITGISETREICENLIEKYQDKHHKDRVFELAWTHSQVILRQMNATEADEQLYGRLAGSVLFPNSSLRADDTVIIKNKRGQSGLWGYSISGDLPIVLLQIKSQNNIVLAKQLIQAHSYWRLKGLNVDLVIWNEDHGGYRQAFQNQILAMIPNELIDRPGGVFVRAADQISNEDRILFQTVARVNISDTNGSLADHINRKAFPKSMIPYIIQIPFNAPAYEASLPAPNNLLFFNGLGGFSPDGKEYVIMVDQENRTPVPWVNVIANPNFGTVVSESGQAYTWVENAHEMRLTPWSNDPVTDSAGEIFYLRDEENGQYWTTTPLPAGGGSPYKIRHGFGYSIFEHYEDGIHSEMCVFVDVEANLKFVILKIRNDSGRQRRLSATGYIEWTMGDIRSKTGMYIITEMDPESGAFIAKNPYHPEFAGMAAFFDVDETVKSYTGDRSEFIGRNKSLQNPDAMHRTKLSGKVGVGLDPCAAIRIPFNLENGAEREMVFRLGADHEGNVNELVNRFRGTDTAYEALDKVKKYWENTISGVTVKTPDMALNIMTNGWLTYQTLSSRLWGRSGFYQSGGAFGFRDQLQDVLSLFFIRPELARKQILLCATRQFEEGDVQHWWHPPLGRGVRTRISDDYLWLPYVTYRYVNHTGDTEILEETLPFLKGRLLYEGEESYYELPEKSEQTATLYEHCARAIKHALRYGEHGLPLMGSGDWNDGMNRVGFKGKGESVWLAFFLYDILIKFVEIANLRNDSEFAAKIQMEAQTLGDNIDKSGWDGKWYRRAYFDDGKTLGSANNTDCQIDSLPQSWSVLSGAGKAKRPRTAMESAGNRLINKESALIQLLEPPFDKGKTDPGYIKGYVPGVRENGGQYTHAAIWMILAYTRLNDNQRVWEMLQMINPIHHGSTRQQIGIYKVEPYVQVADVYASPPHTGRGGWTWYTGSASWMYQLITEAFLGLQQKGDKLHFAPCIPKEWDSFKVTYRYKDTVFNILVTQKNHAGKMILSLDGKEQTDKNITLTHDGSEHEVQVTFFTSSETQKAKVQDPM